MLILTNTSVLVVYPSSSTYEPGDNPADLRHWKYKPALLIAHFLNAYFTLFLRIQRNRNAYGPMPDSHSGPIDPSAFGLRSSRSWRSYITRLPRPSFKAVETPYSFDFCRAVHTCVHLKQRSHSNPWRRYVDWCFVLQLSTKAAKQIGSNLWWVHIPEVRSMQIVWLS